MKHRSLGIALAVGLASLAACKTVESTRREVAPASLEGIAERLEKDLEAKGYQVARGDRVLFTIDDCRYAIESVGNCYGNNPVAPYVLPTVPLWPDEHVDPAMKEALGPMPGDTWPTFRFDEREALVVLARLPPPGAYFGLQTYIYSRTGAIDPADPIFQAAPKELHRLLFAKAPDKERVLVFASMGNSNNHAVVERRSGAAWDQQRFFIATTDAVMERELTDALLRAGVPDGNQVFIEPISGEVARIGLGAEADDFLPLIRYAEPRDEKAGAAWREELPLVVLRVRDTRRARAAEGYPKPAYDRRTASSELELEGDLARLVDAVKQRWKQPDAQAERFFSAQNKLDLVGQHCVERPMNCLGETQDTDTYRIGPTTPIDQGEVIAVVGTLGTATGNATYSNLAVNRFAVLQGVANVSDPVLEGTASAFPVGNADKFYVYYFARDCTGLPNCRALPTSVVPSGETVKIIQRNYIKPGTDRGADQEQLLDPWSIVLDGKARPSSP